MTKVTLMGLGIMGQGMAGNLLQKGFEITLYNRTSSKAEPFAAQGATIAKTPRQAATGTEVILSMVGDDNASREVWLGDEGALAGVQSGAILIECSTLTPAWIHELADLAIERGCKFLDSPVAGSKEAAANAQLALLIGGETDTIEQARPVLEAISRRIVHLGPTGAGATWKLINNMMMAVQLAALSEGLALAEAAQLDMEQIIPLILNGASASMIVQGKLPRILERRYDDTDFALKWMQKDARYAAELADSLGLSLKTVPAAVEVFQMARDKGLDDMDFAAVAEAFRE
ncbi:MAG: NAD(P)-dependent oxidoreductase [Anaerolineae bacterium]|nr:NAD(P)-dependent oxidoreductase [Anaerolineae bacterium]